MTEPPRLGWWRTAMLGFTLSEADSDQARTRFENDHPDQVRELVESERKRWERKQKRAADQADTPAATPQTQLPPG